MSSSTPRANFSTQMTKSRHQSDVAVSLSDAERFLLLGQFQESLQCCQALLENPVTQHTNRDAIVMVAMQALVELGRGITNIDTLLRVNYGDCFDDLPYSLFLLL